MSRRKARQSKHAMLRAKTRLGISKSMGAAAMMRNASRYGISPNELSDTPLKKYVLSKQVSGKRVKLYKSNIFIFNKTSDRCITVYPVPEEFLNEAKLETKKGL